MISQIIAVLSKDLLLEFRSRFGINSVIAFIVSGTLISVYIVGPGELIPTTVMSLFWILIVFAMITAMSRAFVLETDRSTMELLQLHGSPMAVYTGKLLTNFLFTLFVSLITALIFYVLIGFGPLNEGLALSILTIGCIGMAGAATLLSAIVAQTDRKATLFPVIALPMLAPLMLILANATSSLLDGARWDGIADDFMALVGYSGVTISASVLLFEYLWDS